MGCVHGGRICPWAFVFFFLSFTRLPEPDGLGHVRCYEVFLLFSFFFFFFVLDGPRGSEAAPVLFIRAVFLFFFSLLYFVMLS